MFKDEQAWRYKAESELEYLKARDKRFLTLTWDGFNSSFDETRHTRSVVRKKKKRPQIILVCKGCKSVSWKKLKSAMETTRKIIKLY